MSQVKDPNDDDESICFFFKDFREAIMFLNSLIMKYGYIKFLSLTVYYKIGQWDIKKAGEDIEWFDTLELSKAIYKYKLKYKMSQCCVPVPFIVCPILNK